MTRQELQEMVAAYKSQTKEALETVLAELNQGQRKKLMRNEKVRTLFDRFGVNTGEGKE